MYCKHCGAQIPEGVKFCTSCGAKLNEAVQPVTQVSEPKRKALIAPSILAGLAALLFLMQLVIDFRTVMLYADAARYEPFFALMNFRMLITPLLSFLACLLILLYCLTQHRKGKTSLFGGGSLVLMLTQLFAVLFFALIALRYVLNSGSGYGITVSSTSLLYGLLDGICLVLSFILMIGAFRGRIMKTVCIILACVMFTNAALPLFFGKSASELFSFFPGALLSVTLLLVGILAKNK